jgi:polar amino acid transport system substrate-binding protein
MKNLLLAIVVLLFSSQAFADNSVRLMTEEFAPYQFYEGEGDKKEISGISIEIVKAIQKQIGSSDTIKTLPWSRGLKLLAKHKNSALFSTARTPEREDKYKWVGPLAKLEIVFFKSVESKLKIQSIEDAKKIPKIGVTKNVATHEILTNMGFNNLDVMQSGADEKNLKRLIKGRIDVWPTAYYAGIYSSRKMGILDQVEAIPGVSLMSGHLYIAFNKETDSQIIHQWQSALEKLKSDGVVDAILKMYDR